MIASTNSGAHRSLRLRGAEGACQSYNAVEQCKAEEHQDQITQRNVPPDYRHSAEHNGCGPANQEGPPVLCQDDAHDLGAAL